VADGPEGLRIVDITNPLSPVEISHYNTPGNATGIYVLYPYVFLADGSSSGIRVIDVSNPYAPYEIAQYITPGEAVDVYYHIGYIAVADGLGGFRVLDVSALPYIYEFGYYDTPWFAKSVFGDGGLFYVADQSAGFLVLRVRNFTGIYEREAPDYVAVGGGKGILTFKVVSTLPGNANIKVYNTAGKKVLSKDYKVRRGANELILEFPYKGVFIVKVDLPSGKMRTVTAVIR
jgi:hypothetical protein